MISVRRLFVASLTLLFGAFNVSLSMLRLDRYNDTWLTVSIGLIYFAALVICTIAFKKFVLPVWVAVLVSLVAVLIPVASHITLRGEGIETYDTWYVTAIGLLLGALAVRGRSVFSIIAGVIFCAEVIDYGGLEYLPKSGLTGAIILIVSCIAISRGLEASSREIAQAQARAASDLAQLEADKVMAETHEFAKKVALRSTIPVLKKIASGQYFGSAQREEYARKEESLRDDMAGGRLVNRKVKRAVEAARKRGVDVALLDEGGLETKSISEIDELLDLVVASIKSISTGRVTIRTQPDEPWLIRVTASRPRVVTPDLDLKLGER